VRNTGHENQEPHGNVRDRIPRFVERAPVRILVTLLPEDRDKLEYGTALSAHIEFGPGRLGGVVCFVYSSGVQHKYS
jgi:hypothetical protein